MINFYEGWTCKRCGKPILAEEGVYTIDTDPDTMTTSHYKCYEAVRTDFTKALADAKDTLKRAGDLLDKINRIRK